MVNSPYHETAKWLAKILEPIRQSLANHSLRDTFQFTDYLKNDDIRNRQMFSLDVVSLFTNVPLIETIEYICQHIQECNISIPIPLVKLKELLLRCTFNVQFLFNKTLYRQHDGVAMGSPLGPLLADIFMTKLERGPLRCHIETLSHYYRYVDDIFCTAETDKDLDYLLEHFNSAHPAVKFTLEKESNDQLAFLDVLLSRREDGTIRRAVYRKQTHSGQYINFHSFVPMRDKRNLVKSLTYRAHKICSEDTLENELKNVRSMLQDNGYPERFLDKNMILPTEKLATPTVEKKLLYITLPYKGEAEAEMISQKLKQAVNRTYNAASLRCLFSRTPLLKIQIKDKLPRQTNSMVVYSFRCTFEASYIGRTARQLSNRIRVWV